MRIYTIRINRSLRDVPWTTDFCPIYWKKLIIRKQRFRNKQKYSISFVNQKGLYKIGFKIITNNIDFPKLIHSPTVDSIFNNLEMKLKFIYGS